jgi:endonuclease/exonuclease/phosphatase family metal-dependent hydrolase
VPRLYLVIALICAAGVSARGPQAGVAGTADPADGRRLRVATYNIHFGNDERDRYNLQRTVDTIAALDVDVIGVQEVVRNHATYRCDDQPAQIAAGLRRATGKSWTYVYVNEWVTEKRECLHSGRGDDIETEGLAFFAPAASLDVDYVRLWHTRLGLRARVPAAPEVSVVVTHLASSAANLDDRIRQVEVLAPWTERQGPLRILMGDFNAPPQAAEIQPLFAAHRDAWVDARQRGRTLGPRDGSTRPNKESRIDYVTYTPSPALHLESVEVIDTSGLLSPWEASDHRPVVATFRLPSKKAQVREPRD